VQELASDVVIIATGGAPDTGWLPGAEHCTSGWDLMTGTDSGSGQPGREVLVWDGTGRQPAASYADQLSRAKAEVTLVSRDDRVAAEVPYAERAILRKHLAAQGVVTVFEERLVRVSRDGNRLTATFANEMTGDEVARAADQIIAEHGTTPVDEVFHALKGQSLNDGVTDIAALISGRAQPRHDAAGFELYRIGDAVSSRSIHAAMLDAYRLCCRF
jgi:pyruvate/2-oxoglutarate dehydrogenase complex dihydrolipoamide dehydrogenase (E3) component